MKSDLPEIDFYIGPYGISVDRCVLVGSSGEEIKLTPKNMGVLAYLAEHSERVVSSDELLNHFWSPIASDHAVHKAIADLRSALGDSVRRQTYIKTLPRRGYQLLHAPVLVPPPRHSAPQHRVAAGWRTVEFRGYLAAGFGAALVVTFFTGLLREPASKKNVDVVTVGVEQFTVRGNASQAGRAIGEGLTGNLIGQLSKSKRLNIVFINGEARPQPAETDHLLRGTLLHLDGRLRVLVHLVRSSDGVYEYSEKFDFELSEENLFAIEDRIVSSAVLNIATALDIRLGDLRDAPEYSSDTAGYRRLAKGDAGTAGR